MAQKKKQEKKSTVKGLPNDSDIDRVARKINLPKSQWLLLYKIRHLMKPSQPYCYPSQKWFADAFGSSESYIANMISALRKTGLIDVKNGKGRRNNQYRFNYPWPEDMVHTEVKGGSYIGEPTVHPEVKGGSHIGDIYVQRSLKSSKKRSSSSRKKRKSDDDDRKPFFKTKSQAAKTKKQNSTATPKNSFVFAPLPVSTKYSFDSEKEEEKIVHIPDQAPSLLPVELFKKFFKGRMKNLLSEPQNGALLRLITEPFSRESDPCILNELDQSIFKQEIPVAYRKKADDFYNVVIDRHWNDGKPCGAGYNVDPAGRGFKILFGKAFRAGVLYYFGLDLEAELEEKSKRSVYGF